MIKFSLRGIKEVKEFFASLPRGVKIVAMRAFSEYIIGDERHGLKHEPEYKHVSPFQSYSDDPKKAARQRGWIFTHLDLIGKDNRTHKIRDSWTMTEKDSNWTSVKIENTAPGVGWVMGEEQSRHSAAVGWRKYTDIVVSNIDGALRSAISAVDAWLKSKNK